MCTLLRGEPRTRGGCQAAVRNTARWAPTPTHDLASGQHGRQEVWKQIRKNRVFIHACVYEEGKNKECQLQMKLKPLALMRNTSQGPGHPKAQEPLGVCREQSDSGARGGDQGPARGEDGPHVCPSGS